MVGGTPSVLRASCMALLVLIARFTGRTYDVGRALIISGFIMVFINPYLLVFDTSFQLSFLSTIALIWISPIVERYLEWIPHRFGLREVTCATLSTQLFVLPLILLKIGQVSLVGLPVNLLVLGVIPLLMLIGFVTGLLGYVAYAVSLPFAFLSHIILSYVFLVVKIFDSLSFASISIPHFGATLFITSYVFYGIAFVKLRIKKKGT
jgi:competence protein ComEC